MQAFRYKIYMEKDSQKNKHGGGREKTRDNDQRGAKKGRFGNAPFKATDQQRKEVEDLAKVLTAAQIGSKLGVSESTINRHFPDELMRGITTPTAIIGSKLMKQAMEGCKTSQIFYLKTRGGWNQRHEVSGPGGGPIETKNFDFSNLSMEEKKLLRKSLGHILSESEDSENNSEK